MTTERWGENTADDYNSRITDCRPSENDPTNSNCAIANMTTGNGGGAGIDYRSLMRIEPNQDISGETVNSATLKIRKSGGAAGDDINVYRVLLNWVDGEGDWNEYSTGNNWNTAGCDAASDVTGEDSTADRRSTPEDTTVSGSSGVYHEWDITSLVQGWVDGSISEYGIILISQDGESAQQFQNWNSSEASDGQRPYLEITYGEAGQDSGEAIPLNVYT